MTTQVVRYEREGGCGCGCGTIIIIALLLYIIHLMGGC